MFMKVGATWYEVNPVEEARVDDLDPELVAKALADPNRHDPLKKVSPKGIGSRELRPTRRMLSRRIPKP